MSKQEQLIECFLHLPEKLLLFHEIENISEFVLHTLCGQKCFNLSKAAYFIDNYDFNCLKGVAGFDKNESYHDNDSIWDNVDVFSNHMKQCLFNQKVRAINRHSELRLNKDNQNHDFIKYMADNLSIDKPFFYSWKIKYDNYGILIFETLSKKNDIDLNLIKAMCLLGFCPIF